MGRQGVERIFQDKGITYEKVPRQEAVWCRPRTARRLLWPHWGGGWQEISFTVLLQASKRNVCEHALPSTNPARYLCENEHSHQCFRSPVLSSRHSRSKRKKHLHTRFTSSSILPKLTISLIFAIKLSASRFSICIIRSLKTRPKFLSFLYKTGVL